MKNRLVTGAALAAIAAGTLAAVPPERVFSMTISGGGLPPEQRIIIVTKDEMVRLRVTADVAGDLHLHGYRLELKLASGKPAEIAFKARATGRYPFEWHEAGEKSKAARHLGPEFGVLEVHPK